MFPLNTVLFPGVTVPLHVFEDRYRALVHHLLRPLTGLITNPAGFLQQVGGALLHAAAFLWGDVLRFRRGNADLPGNGAPSQLGAIRTIGVSAFKDGKVEAVSGDTFYAVIEFSTPQRGEVLLNYGNWSKAGSKHIEDQLPLASRKEMRPMWRDRKDIEANLESRKAF